jgi:hypothetical protein
MTRSHPLRPGLCLAVALSLGAGLACLHPSPAVVYHTLQPMPPPPPLPPVAAGSAAIGAAAVPALEVLPVRLPDLLRRPQMVLAEGGGDALGLSETHRWGNPLEQDMQRVLVADLGLLRPGGPVVPSPDGARVAAALRLEVTVQSCVGRPGQGLVLQATWMVTRTGQDRALLFRRTELREPLDPPGPDGLAAAHSRILAALARQIAAALAELPASQP